jgi:DNA-binding NtrC family response regulator
MEYDWPGNVRELENAMERAVVLGDAEEILPEDLPRCIWETPASEPESDYYCALKHSKRRLIVRALGQANGHYIEAARILGLHPNSLLRLIRSLGLKTSARELPAS